MVRQIKLICIYVIIISITISLKVHAWDGERKGFILGTGLGVGLVSFTQTANGIELFDDIGSTFASDFSIGYAPNNMFQIYYFSKVSWFRILNILNENVTIADGVAGVGISYYFNEYVPSSYILGGIGFSSWSTPLEENTDTWEGNGFVVGCGYEFSRHFNLESTITWGNPSIEEFGIDYETDSFTLNIYLNIIGY